MMKVYIHILRKILSKVNMNKLLKINRTYQLINKNMKNRFSILIVIATIIASCTNSYKPQQTYANEEEKRIIDTMGCWESSYSKSCFNIALLTQDKDKHDEYFQHAVESIEESNKKGRDKFKNDTLVINLIRNDSLLQDLKNQRKLLAKKILPFKKTVPFFEKQIDKIRNEIIEYNCLDENVFGIYEYTFKKDEYTYVENKVFYKNYSDLLKEGYKLLENSKFRGDEIKQLNNILASIEDIDRKLWLTKYYFEAKQNIEMKNMKKIRAQKVDSLFQK
jgi:hypothetical protein